MIYTEISIENYKGIKKLILPLKNDQNIKTFTLVGLNESGKTTILEAISLLNIQGTNYNVNDFIPKNKRHNFNGKIDLTARLEFDEKDINKIEKFLAEKGYFKVSIAKSVILFKVYQFKDSIHQVGSNQRLCLFDIKVSKGKSKNILKIDSKHEVNISVHNFILTELIPPILYYPNFLFDFPERIYLEEETSESEEQRTYREVINDILNSIDPTLDINTHLIDRIKADTRDAKRNVEAMLLKMSGIVTKKVFNAWDALFDSYGKEIIINYDLDEQGRIYLEFNLRSCLETGTV